MKSTDEILGIIETHQENLIQQVGDCAAFCNCLQAESPRLMLQIGCFFGSDTAIYCRVCDDLNVVAVDILPEAGGLIPSDLRESRVSLLAPFDSRTRQAYERVVEEIGVRPVDVLFIDGDHDIDSVISDYAMYSPLVRDGGLIAFHDINLWRERDPARCHVPLVWSALSRIHGAVMETRGDGIYGFGVIRKRANRT